MGKTVTLKETTLWWLVPVLIFIGMMFALAAIGTFGNGSSLFGSYAQTVMRAQTNLYSYEASMWDNTTKSIAEQCENKPTRLQPDCVMNIVKPFFNYTMHEDMLRLPSEYAELGGVCGDTSLLHASIFRKLDWSVKFVFPTPNHIYIIISKEVPCAIETGHKCYVFCDLDGDQHVCKILQ